MEELISAFNNAGELKADRDIVIAPTALHLGFAQSLFRKEIEVAAQNIWKVNVLCLFSIVQCDYNGLGLWCLHWRTFCSHA